MENDEKLKLAINAHKEKDYVTAQKFYEEILKDDPKNYHVNFYLGNIKAHYGNFDEAKNFFEKAILLNKNFIQAHLNLANSLKEIKNFDKAETAYFRALKIDPNNAKIYYNLGLLWQDQKKYQKAEKAYENAIKINKDFFEAYNNLGIIFNDQEKLEDAKLNFEKAIQINSKFFQAHMNLGSVLKKLIKLNEAEKSFKKAIELNPNYYKAFNNLGNVMGDAAKLDEAVNYYKKAIELNPNFIEPKNNLRFVLKQLELVKIIGSCENKTISTLENNPFLSSRIIEDDLIKNLYEINTIELNQTIKYDARYGNGVCSKDFHLFDDTGSILKNVIDDLKIIMSDAVKGKIFIIDSFFNILKSGGGTTPHKHINQFDKTTGLINQKYSLTYYVSVGDQDCTEPGYLKLYDPDEKILPSNGTIVIIPASRSHSAIYNGNKDRIMIGINFYSYN